MKMKKARKGICRCCGFSTNDWAYWCFFCSIQFHQNRSEPELTEVAKEWLKKNA